MLSLLLVVYTLYCNLRALARVRTALLLFVVGVACSTSLAGAVEHQSHRVIRTMQQPID